MIEANIRKRRPMSKTCETCGGELKKIYPNVEEYTENKFCWRIPFTPFKVMLFKEEISLGCENCLIEHEETLKRDEYGAIAAQIGQDAYWEGHADGQRGE
jgi:hypothetical protein